MSFLPKAADDDSAVLRELFEVVDEWTASSSNSVAASGSASLSKDASHQKRKRDPAVDVRRRLKKKAERTKLRQHVEELQHQLERLRRQPSRDNLDDNCVGTEPQHHTDIETRAVSPDIRALADAEALNESLRGELAKSSAMLRALEESISVMTVRCQFGELNRRTAVLVLHVHSCAFTGRLRMRIPTNQVERSGCIYGREDVC